jgi:hypothetical protein
VVRETTTVSSANRSSRASGRRSRPARRPASYGHRSRAAAPGRSRARVRRATDREAAGRRPGRAARRGGAAEHGVRRSHHAGVGHALEASTVGAGRRVPARPPPRAGRDRSARWRSTSTHASSRTRSRSATATTSAATGGRSSTAADEVVHPAVGVVQIEVEGVGSSDSRERAHERAASSTPTREHSRPTREQRRGRAADLVGASTASVAPPAAAQLARRRRCRARRACASSRARAPRRGCSRLRRPAARGPRRRGFRAWVVGADASVPTRRGRAAGAYALPA